MAQAVVCKTSNAPDALVRQITLFVLLMFIAVRALAGSATLAWEPVANPALVGYMLYYGPAAGNYTAKIDVGNTTQRTVANLVDGATYHFAVTAYDGSRTETAFSNDATATLPAGVPVAGFTASATSGVAPLAMNFTNTSTGGITAYAWTFGDGMSSSAPSPSHVYAAAGTYTVSLTVTGPGGSNTKTVPNYVTVTAPPNVDTSPPTAPSTVAASAAGGAAINLSWGASTDNVGVTGYRIERCQGAGCNAFAQIATSTGATFSNTGLAAGTSYSYRVRATDAAGNVGAYSNTATAVTATVATPTLTGNVTLTSGYVDLTAVGSRDWVQWPGSVRKVTGNQIGELTLIGSTTFKTYSDDGRTMAWSDGTPTPTGSTNSGVSLVGTGKGFQLTAPADTTTRTLTVYVGLQNTTGTLRAHLSDGAAADYVNSFSAQAQRSDGAYTLTYRAKSAGQTITVTWTQNKGAKSRGGMGDISLQGAALR